MKNLITALIAFSATLAFSATPPQPARAQTLADALEAKLATQLKRLFGEDTRLSATVHVKAAAFARTETKPGKSFDMGYLPVPVELDKLRQGAQPAAEEMLNVESVDVDVFADASLPDDLVAHAEDVAKSSLKGFNPTVTVKRIRTASASKVASPLTSPLLFGMAAGGLLLALGLFLFGVFVARGLGRLGNSMEAAAATRFSFKPSPPATDVPKTATELEPPRPVLPLPSSSIHDPARNIQLVDKALGEAPRLLLAAFDAKQGDAAGLRWLLPKLGDEARAAFHSGLLPVDLLSQIDRAAVSDRREEEWVIWLQGFAERLTIHRMRGGSPLEKALGSDTYNRLVSLPAMKVAEWVCALEPQFAAAGWRLIIEILSPKDLEAVLTRLPNEQWERIAHARNIPLSELPPFAEHMVSELAGSAPAQDGSGHSLPMEKLVEPLVSLLREKALGEDDAFIDELAVNFPELPALIAQRFWTPRLVDRVPEDSLQAAFRGAGNEVKSAVVALMPPAIAERFEDMLPEGNVRTVVLDRVKRLNASATPGEKRASLLLARQFLDALRAQAAEGRFDLLAEGNAPERRFREAA